MAATAVFAYGSVAWVGLAAERPYDLVIFGATGVDGQFAVRHLVERRERRDGARLRWALGGRSLSRLEGVRDTYGAPPDTPLLVADALDMASVLSVARATRVIATTVGPYTTLGGNVVAACAQSGTDYVDLGGDAAWIAQQIALHNHSAVRTGARLVVAGGFGAVPFDVGVLWVQREAERCFGAAARLVRARVHSESNGFSGGSVAAARAKFRAVTATPALYDLYSNPYALAGGGRQEGPAQAAFPPSAVEGTRLARSWDGRGDVWLTPFPHLDFVYYQVHLTNALLNMEYGADFVYEQRNAFPTSVGGFEVSQEVLLGALDGGGAYDARRVLNVTVSPTDRDDDGRPLLADAPLAPKALRYFEEFMRYTGYDHTLGVGDGGADDPHGVRARSEGAYATEILFSAEVGTLPVRRGEDEILFSAEVGTLPVRRGEDETPSLEPRGRGGVVRAKLAIDGDVYVATARLMVEVAACLAERGCARATSGGFYSPAAAVGDAFVERMVSHARVAVATPPTCTAQQ